MNQAWRRPKNGLNALFVAGCVSLVVLLSACSKAEVDAAYLPWNSEVTAAGQTQIFHLTLGESTLKEAIQQWQSFPEIAVFVDRADRTWAEAYFARKRFGSFEARVITELATTDRQLTQFRETATERKPQASGAWRYTLSEASVTQANELKIQYLVYIPVAKYSAEAALKHFGEPTETIEITESAQYWLYPAKGLILLLNQAGHSLFYYSATADYEPLKQRLLTLGTEPTANQLQP